MKLRVLGKRSLSSFCLILTNITLLAGIAVIIFMPFVFSLIRSSVFNIFFFGNQYYISLISLEAGLVIVWLILNEFRKLLKKLVSEDAFSRSNPIYLNRISILSMSIGAIMFIKCFVDFSYITLISMIITFALCLFAKIFSGIMLRAAYLKEHLELVV